MRTAYLTRTPKIGVNFLDNTNSWNKQLETAEASRLHSLLLYTKTVDGLRLARKSADPKTAMREREVAGREA